MVFTISSPSSSLTSRHIRSVSFPCRSHPNILQVEEEIAYLKTHEPSLSIDTVEKSLMRLERLYASVNNLLILPQTQKSLSHKNDEKLVDELLDRSMRLLDVCGSIKDAMEQVKQHIRNVQSAIRRKKEGLKIDANLSVAKMKDAKRTILALKQIDNKIGGVDFLDLDHHLSTVIRSFRDTSALSVSIFGSLVSLESVFMSKPKSTKWSVVSKLVRKGKEETEDKPRISSEALESHIEVVENSLECMFRTLIKTRVSLLNIRSH